MATIDRSQTYVKILEEPAAKALRFRYECEGRSAGSLPGANSTHDKKSYPKIQVVCGNGGGGGGGSGGGGNKGVVVVSCVTVDPPYRPHPHNLVGKEGCKKGVCTLEITPNEQNQMICEFSNLGIQCVKKKDIEESLKIREEIRVDPFRTNFSHKTQPGSIDIYCIANFSHKTQPGSIDLNAVRLCFQVFLEGPERGQFKVPLKPVVSEAIYDKKAINDLTIMKLSDCTSPVMGNKEIILLCDKVSKDDIEVRFYEEVGGVVVWESFGDFQPSDVHKQYAITFRTPAFRDLEITTPHRTYIQLRCPSKDTTSMPRPFDFIPISSDVELISLKRKRLNNQQNRIDNHLNNGINSFLQPHPPVAPAPSSQISPVQQQQPHPFLHQQHQHQLQLFPQQSSSSSSSSQQSQFQQQQQQFYPPPQPPPTNPNQMIIKQEPGQQQQQNQNYYYNNIENNKEQNNYNNMEFSSNISLPNLSDVNLSLLESHLSENFNENLNISENF